ncbi:MAG: hypothetical protein Q9226_003371 [Calogaya cf. arnoldii]
MAGSLNGPDDQCSKIGEAISANVPEVCQQFGDFGDWIPSALFQSPSNEKPENSSTQCDSDDVGTAHPLVSTSVWGEGSTRDAKNGEFNQTDYDTAIQRVVPFIYSIGAGASSWGAKTGLICMRAKDVTAGSRVPSPLENGRTSEETDSTRLPPPDYRSGNALRSKEMTLAGIIGLAVMAVVLG